MKTLAQIKLSAIARVKPEVVEKYDFLNKSKLIFEKLADDEYVMYVRDGQSSDFAEYCLTARDLNSIPDMISAVKLSKVDS